MDPKHLRTVLEAALAGTPLAPALTFRAMFGGIMAYVDGRPFISLYDGGMALKLSPSDQLALLAEPGAARLQYAPTEPVSKLSIVLPAEYLDDPGLLRAWAEKSAAFVRTLPAKKK